MDSEIAKRFKLILQKQGIEFKLNTAIQDAKIVKNRDFARRAAAAHAEFTQWFWQYRKGHSDEPLFFSRALV